MEEGAAGFPPGSATSGSGNYGGPLVTYKCGDSHKRQLAMSTPNCDIFSRAYLVKTNEATFC